MQTGRRQARRAPDGKSTVVAPAARIEGDLRSNDDVRHAIRLVAPGTDLRAGIEDIIRSHEGALIVIGEPEELSFLYSGGMRLDLEFTAQHLYELAKMDGAIVVDPTLTRIAYANVQLMPDPTISSTETGTRHRTAERVAKQTGALVLSISQQRETVTLFVSRFRYQLERITDILAKTNQALATLGTYRERLDQVLTRLTALEFQNAVVLDDVLVVLQRAEMTSRMAAEVELDCIELGTEGRLIRMQLDELVQDVPTEKAAVIIDYHVDGSPERVRESVDVLTSIRYEQLLDFELLAVLGYPASVNPLDLAVSPRGYRVLSHIPRVPDTVIRRLVTHLDGLESIVRASHRELEAVEGVGPSRAREIREGLRRLQEHNLVDRYLQL